MIKMAQFHIIKYLYEVEGLSQRKIANKLGISRNTVSKYLKSNQPPTIIQREKSYGKKEFSSETKRILPIIDQWLEEDFKRWGKQRHTAANIHRRLVREYGFKESESNIRKIVRERKKVLQEVFIPLEFQLGHQFPFDWGEADIILQGKKRRVFLFYAQLSASRVRFVRAYLHEKQEAFLDGFVHAFEFFGGIPTEGLFDNLKTSVQKILQGRNHLEQESFLALQTHYLFKAEFCNPSSGNEKGRVEGSVGYVRRNALVPEPEVQSIEEFNEYLFHWCLEDAKERKVPHSNELVVEMWEKEKEYLHPLPEQRFEACRLVSPINKTLETYDFSLMPSLNKNRLMKLAKGEFVERKENIIFLGNSGTGKTHLAIALGMEMILNGYKVKFTTAYELVEQLLISNDEHKLGAFENKWLKYDVIIVDELGYVPFSKIGVELLFQFFSNRYERGSVMITTNLEFSEWTNLFGNEKITTALLDRLTHKAHILLLNGEPYRFRESLKHRKTEE
ncbi:MAG: IS21 family transposase [Lysinibacillus sp.]|nr:IS21 family transposase [Lysinibacillus sp.]